MKRPFAVIGITYLLSQAVAAYLGAAFAAVCAIVAIIATVLYVLLCEKRNTVVVTASITVSVAMLMSFAYTKLYVENVVPVEGQAAVIRGQIIEEPYEQYGRFYYILKTEMIDAEGVRQKIKIRISSSEYIDAEYSDIFEGTVTFTSYSNENSYTSKRRLLAKGILATAYVSDGTEYTLSSGNDSLYSYAISFRNKLKRTVKALYTGEAGDVLIAMITGDESNISSDTLSAFRNTGIAHIIAVSGLHMSLLAFAVTKLLQKLLINRKVIAVIVSAVCWFYVAVAGFPMSSIRAAIMITVMLFGVLVDRLHTPLNSMGIALLIICLTNPYAAIDSGLLMSFSSTLGLLVAAPPLSRFLNRVLFKDKSGAAIGILRDIVNAASVAITASIFILPASVLYFGKISLLSPLVNLCLVSLSEVFLGLGMFTVFIAMLGSIGSFIAYPLMTVDWLFGKIIIFAVKMFNSIPVSTINTGKNTAIVVFGCVLICIVWGLLFANSKEKRKSLIVAVFCCVSVCFVWFCCERLLTDTKSVTIYNVGDAAVVTAVDGKSAVMLGAGGDSYSVSLAQYSMQDKGITELTALVLTDLSDDGASCAKAIVENMNPCEVFATDSGFYRDTVEYVTSERSITLNSVENKAICTGDIRLECLPDNEGLLWCNIKCGSMSVLVCPDNGNALNCPFGVDFDVAIMTDIPACVAAINASTYILCTDYSHGAVLVSQLMARGLRNVYCTGISGNIELAVREGRLYIGCDNL